MSTLEIVLSVLCGLGWGSAWFCFHGWKRACVESFHENDVKRLLKDIKGWEENHKELLEIIAEKDRIYNELVTAIHEHVEATKRGQDHGD